MAANAIARVANLLVSATSVVIKHSLVFSMKAARSCTLSLREALSTFFSLYGSAGLLPVSALEKEDILDTCLNCAGLGRCILMWSAEGRNCLVCKVSKEALLMEVFGLMGVLREVLRSMKVVFMMKGRSRVYELTLGG